MKKIILLVVTMVAMLSLTASAHGFIFGDTDFSDWDDITEYTDPTGDAPWHDYTGLRVMQDTCNLYLCYRTLHDANPTWIFWGFFDTKLGGLTEWEGRKLNADYYYQGNKLYTNSDTYWNPKNETILTVNQNGDKTLTEIAIPRSRIEDAKTMNITLAINQGSGVEDWLPGRGAVTHTVPEPISFLLLGSGLAGLVAFTRKKKK